ncbi:MAG TPA: arginine decarboxylase, partial [Luteimonas sp.]|nr:arginine decarboxylase [Luteimonas sp.]
DIHNLFGDTDSVSVQATDAGFSLVQQRRGDTTDVMLDYVGYKLDALRAAYRDKVAAAQLPDEEAERLGAALEAGLTAYTYLSDAPLPLETGH